MSLVTKSAEEFARRAYDLNLLTQRQLESVWSELGTRSVSAADLQRVLVRRGLLTNYQVDKLARGDRAGFFYGDYKVLYLVGSGSFARVYRAVPREGEGDKVVALKVLRKRFSDDPAMADQFIREGQMGAKLRHPNIVPIYEVHSEKRMHYMVMDFIEGRNLREFIQVRKSLSPEEAIKFMIDITSGLAYAAGMGVYHRDLKLSNVLMSSTGRAQLVDFGLAAVTSGAEGDVGEMVNPRTIDYAGLERATGVRKDDPRSDIYFAGCIFYHLLSGHAPLPETRDRAQRLSRSRFENVVPINQRVPDLPRRVAAIVQKAMELNVDRRFQTAAEFLADLQATARRLKGDTEGDNAIVIDEGQDRAVLIVDSNAEVQNALRTALRKLGYRVLVVSDSQRALDRLNTRERVADCVVIGCHSLGKAGLECFNQLALSEQTRRTPAILMLAEKQRPWAQHAKLSDTRVIANMPLKMREFRTLLRDVLKRAANGRSA